MAFSEMRGEVTGGMLADPSVVLSGHNITGIDELFRPIEGRVDRGRIHSPQELEELDEGGYLTVEGTPVTGEDEIDIPVEEPEEIDVAIIEEAIGWEKIRQTRLARALRHLRSDNFSRGNRREVTYRPQKSQTKYDDGASARKDPTLPTPAALIGIKGETPEETLKLHSKEFPSNGLATRRAQLALEAAEAEAIAQEQDAVIGETFATSSTVPSGEHKAESGVDGSPKPDKSTRTQEQVYVNPSAARSDRAARIVKARAQGYHRGREQTVAHQGRERLAA